MIRAAMMELARELETAIQASIDPEYLEKLVRTVPGARVIGVRVPALREIVRNFRAAHKDLTLDEACDLMDLLSAGSREAFLAGAFLLGSFGKARSKLPWKRLVPWIDHLDNWETCDQLASNLGGELVAADLSLVDELLALAESENPWKRRFALATVSELNHKKRSHPEMTFRVCEKLLDDQEKTVRMALAWALKEASGKASRQVYLFLKEHHGRMPASVLREAASKLDPDQRDSLIRIALNPG
jgi:3-methyladenine DNA glycosylase AlkD